MNGVKNNLHVDDGGKAYTIDEAFEYCARITNGHYENFPVASLFLPEEKRPYIQAIYAFSRRADDFADDPSLSKEERLEKLNFWGDELRRCYDGEADHPVFIALKETVRKNEIPIEPLSDLLSAFRRDTFQNRYETFDDLISYCKCSANPIGRLLLMIFSYRDEKLFGLSDHICTALQLANFWQDARADRANGRLYIPEEDFEKHGYTVADYDSGLINDNFKRLMKFETERTRDMFYRGAELPSLVSKDLQIELKLVWFGGMEILKKIKKQDYDVLNKKIRLSAFDKFMVLLRALLFDELQNYKKKRKRKEPWDLT